MYKGRYIFHNSILLDFSSRIFLLTAFDTSKKTSKVWFFCPKFFCNRNIHVRLLLKKVNIYVNCGRSIRILIKYVITMKITFCYISVGVGKSDGEIKLYDQESKISGSYMTGQTIILGPWDIARRLRLLILRLVWVSNKDCPRSQPELLEFRTIYV